MERDVLELALRFYEGLNCPRSLSAAIMLRAGEWDQLVSLSADPGNYLSAASYATAAAASDFLRKCQGLKTSFDLEAIAKERWRDGERQCFRTNERLAPYLLEVPNSEDRDVRIAAFFAAVRKKVVSMVGRRPPSHDVVRFGPGATYSDRGRFTAIPHKISRQPSWTGGAFWYLLPWASTAWGRYAVRKGIDPVKVRGNRFTTVPKDAKTDRAIAAEPSLNIFFQLGLGSALRSRLADVGLDLNKGQDIHRQVACESSIRGHLATMDLSNASDTLSLDLVRLVMPTGWFEALTDLRSPFSLIEGKWVRLEKFSSMGNGFTFELETLVFAALCSTACDFAGVPHKMGRDLLVYGDDIICPTSAARAVKSVLEFCGFSLNSKKSFLTGNFRESCGGDFYNGHPVRGHFLKELPNEPQDWIVLANGINRLRKQLSPLGEGSALTRAWLFATDQVPQDIRRCRGPSDLGDIVIHDDLRYWQIKMASSIRYVRVYRPARHRKVKYSLFHPDVVLACALYGCGWNDGGVTPRDSVLGYKRAWVPFS